MIAYKDSKHKMAEKSEGKECCEHRTKGFTSR